MMKSSNIELLSQETTRLLGLQIDTLNEALQTNNFLNTAPHASDAKEKQETRVEEFEAWISHLQNEQQKLDKLEMVLAVVGTVKSGKSTTINAIVGTEILPNRVTPMTTLPTLIRNIHGQSEPVLKIAKITPLLELSQKVATKLQQLDDTAKNKINLQGVEDSKALIDQLIQQGGYPFKTEYSGQAGIVAFLTHLNDIMRLAKDAAVDIDVDSTYSAYQNLDDLPVIEVEFYHLKDNNDVAHGSLAILDTPGPNEFGQSDALQVVFTTQLAKASAVLLVTDFTQMNTEADHAVREQLKIIKQQLSKEHLYVIVNKFDNADPSNTSSKDQIKNNVKESVARLIKNYVDIDVSQVFPVSSKSAYLANRAKRHLDQHEKLPCHKQESWVASFAEKALIDLEDDDIGDKDFVKKRIEKLWKNSFFAEPIDKVIKEAHADAANRSLDSAIKKLAYYNNEFLNEFSIYSATITKDIKKDIEKIKEMRVQLEGNIASCEQVKNEVTEITSDNLLKLEKEIDGVMSSQKNDIDNRIKGFFNDGKKTEEARKKTVEIIMNNELEKVDSRKEHLTKFHFNNNAFEASKKEKKERIKKQYGEQLEKFDPTSKKIIFNDMEISKLYTVMIIENIADIFHKADKELNIIATSLIENTKKSISEKIDTTVNETLRKAEEKLEKSSGINLKFNLLPINLKIPDIDASVLFTAGHKKECYIVTSSRYKDNIWGEFCKFLNTDDMGKEKYEEEKTNYIVDLEEIEKAVADQLKQQISQVSNNTKHYLNDKFQPIIDKHLAMLVDYLKKYLNVLDVAMESSKLDEADKTALIKQLATLLKTQTTLKGDIEAINSAV